MATETESGRELRRRMSETLVPGAWAEASGRWCQNSVLRGCGQTKIKGAGAPEWHHTHMHAYTRLNGLSQIGFIMSQPLGLSNTPPPVHNAVWLNKQHTPAVQRQGERKRKRRESREVKKALATPLCSFHWCQRQIGEFPSRSHPFFLEPLHRSFCAYPYKYASKSTVRRKSAKKATKLDYSLIFPAQKCVRVKSVTVFSARLCRLSDRRSKLKHFWVRSVDAYQPLQRLSCWLYRSQHGAQQCCHGNG